MPNAIKSKHSSRYSQLLSLSLISGTHVLFCLNSVYSQNQIKGWQTMAHGPKLAIAYFYK